MMAHLNIKVSLDVPTAYADGEEDIRINLKADNKTIAKILRYAATAVEQTVPHLEAKK